MEDEMSHRHYTTTSDNADMTSLQHHHHHYGNGMDFSMYNNAASFTVNTDDTNKLCHGMGMIMYMEGFQWTLRGNSSCLNFYFPTWILDTKLKFYSAMICVICMGILTEGLNRLRHDMNRKINKRKRQRHRQQGRSNSYEINKLWYLQTLLQGLSALMAYILMLATMMYSLEILCCVVLGLVIGYFIFGGDLYNHAGSPCCNFLEDEEEDDGTTTSLMGALLPRDEEEKDEQEERISNSGYQSAIHHTGGMEACCNTTVESGSPSKLNQRQRLSEINDETKEEA